MIVWDDNLRCTERMKSREQKVRRRLSDRKLSSVLSFCVTFPSNPSNLLDIYDMGELLFRHYSSSPDEVHIIGLAESKSAAQQLVAELLEETLAARGDTDVRAYFESLNCETKGRG